MCFLNKNSITNYHYAKVCQKIYIGFRNFFIFVSLVEKENYKNQYLLDSHKNKEKNFFNSYITYTHHKQASHESVEKCKIFTQLKNKTKRNQNIRQQTKLLMKL